jgi:hypothetical protein
MEFNLVQRHQNLMSWNKLTMNRIVYRSLLSDQRLSFKSLDRSGNPDAVSFVGPEVTFEPPGL